TGWSFTSALPALKRRPKVKASLRDEEQTRAACKILGNDKPHGRATATGRRCLQDHYESTGARVCSAKQADRREEASLDGDRRVICDLRRAGDSQLGILGQPK